MLDERGKGLALGAAEYLIKPVSRDEMLDALAAGPVSVVLIVEDNPRNLKLVRDVLGHAGYATLEACDGEAGIALAREQRPDLMLMDINLPGMTASRRSRRCAPTPRPPRSRSSALTAYAMKDDRARFLAAGFDGYLEKPVSVRELPARSRR